MFLQGATKFLVGDRSGVTIEYRGIPVPVHTQIQETMVSSAIGDVVGQGVSVEAMRETMARAMMRNRSRNAALIMRACVMSFSKGEETCTLKRSREPVGEFTVSLADLEELDGILDSNVELAHDVMQLTDALISATTLKPEEKKS